MEVGHAMPKRRKGKDAAGTANKKKIEGGEWAGMGLDRRSHSRRKCKSGRRSVRFWCYLDLSLSTRVRSTAGKIHTYLRGHTHTAADGPIEQDGPSPLLSYFINPRPSSPQWQITMSAVVLLCVVVERRAAKERVKMLCSCGTSVVVVMSAYRSQQGTDPLSFSSAAGMGSVNDNIS